MKNVILALVCCFGTMASAGKYWSDDQIGQALGLVGQGRALEAAELVRTWNASPHDFGIDLLSRGRGIESLYWFQAISAPEVADWEINRAGHAWAQFMVGQKVAARTEAETLLQSADPRVLARAAYLMAMMDAIDGNLASARNHAMQSRALFATLESERGLEIVDRLIGWMSSFKAEGMTLPPSPVEWLGDGE
jgi:hypothetical protein